MARKILYLLAIHLMHQFHHPMDKRQPLVPVIHHIRSFKISNSSESLGDVVKLRKNMYFDRHQRCKRSVEKCNKGLGVPLGTQLTVFRT